MGIGRDPEHHHRTAAPQVMFLAIPNRGFSARENAAALANALAAVGATESDINWVRYGYYHTTYGIKTSADGTGGDGTGNALFEELFGS